jgi:uncharacterized protein YifE (UPF0438 family)
MAVEKELLNAWNKHNGRMRKLASGETEPSSENEIEFIKFLNNEKEAETVFEKAWRHFIHLQTYSPKEGKQYLWSRKEEKQYL